LEGLPLGPVRYFDRIDSTNTEAAFWADQGAPDLALVVANEQTAGRGRQGRHWFTPPGAALAFSLVLRDPISDAQRQLTHLIGLGALALADTLQYQFHLAPEIKWPNDVLLRRRKVAGILVEAHWQGEHLDAVILGIGVNVASQSLPADSELVFPATTLEHELGKVVPRGPLLRNILERILAWRDEMHEARFLQAWEQQLAFRNEWVQLSGANNLENNAQRVKILGLDERGCLRVQEENGLLSTVLSGEVRLRPLVNG
jgi:BirA family biotin operon repressor/biotin-[acetyl-CoA-carboxylase] ligase